MWKAAEERERVEARPRRAEPERLRGDEREDAHVHRIARVAVEPAGDQLLGRIDRRGRAGRAREVGDAPGVDGEPASASSSATAPSSGPPGESPVRVRIHHGTSTAAVPGTRNVKSRFFARSTPAPVRLDDAQSRLLSAPIASVVVVVVVVIVAAVGTGADRVAVRPVGAHGGRVDHRWCAGCTGCRADSGRSRPSSA